MKRENNNLLMTQPINPATVILTILQASSYSDIVLSIDWDKKNKTTQKKFECSVNNWDDLVTINLMVV